MADNKEKNAPKSVTLKRTVTIKAVVTEKFKQYMDFELQSGKQMTTTRLKQIDEELGRSDMPPVVREKLTLERDQLKQSFKELDERSDSIKDLEIGSHYVQGMVDGFVTINVGDNLYEKLGAMEIVVVDGKVENIVPVSALPEAGASG